MNDAFEDDFLRLLFEEPSAPSPIPEAACGAFYPVCDDGAAAPHRSDGPLFLGPGNPTLFVGTAPAAATGLLHHQHHQQQHQHHHHQQHHQQHQRARGYSDSYGLLAPADGHYLSPVSVPAAFRPLAMACPSIEITPGEQHTDAGCCCAAAAASNGLSVPSPTHQHQHHRHQQHHRHSAGDIFHRYREPPGGVGTVSPARSSSPASPKLDPLDPESSRDAAGDPGYAGRPFAPFGCGGGGCGFVGGAGPAQDDAVSLLFTTIDLDSRSPHGSPVPSPPASAASSAAAASPTAAPPPPYCVGRVSPRGSMASPPSSASEELHLLHPARSTSPYGGKRRRSGSDAAAAGGGGGSAGASPHLSPAPSPSTSRRSSVNDGEYSPLMLLLVPPPGEDGDPQESIPSKSRRTSQDHTAPGFELQQQQLQLQLLQQQLLLQQQQQQRWDDADGESPAGSAGSSPFAKAEAEAAAASPFLLVPACPWTAVPKPVVAYGPESVPSLARCVPSRAGGCELRLDEQPRSHHRAHYETEGSRGAVKAASGSGHPVVTLSGYNETPLTLQMFIGTADERPVRPHPFYQVHRITGKTVATQSRDATHGGHRTLELALLPDNGMSAVIDCAGIQKLRNSDIELRKGETDVGRKNTRVRLVFRVAVPQPGGGGAVTLQAASTAIECSQRSAQELPVLERVSASACSVAGGDRIHLHGNNFTPDSKVTFTHKGADGRTLWEAEGRVDKESVSPTRLSVVVPPYRDAELPAPVGVMVVVSNGKQKRSQQQHHLQYHPQHPGAGAPLVKQEPFPDPFPEAAPSLSPPSAAPPAPPPGAGGARTYSLPCSPTRQAGASPSRPVAIPAARQHRSPQRSPTAPAYAPYPLPATDLHQPQRQLLAPYSRHQHRSQQPQQGMHPAMVLQHHQHQQQQGLPSQESARQAANRHGGEGRQPSPTRRHGAADPPVDAHRQQFEHQQFHQQFHQQHVLTVPGFGRPTRLSHSAPCLTVFGVSPPAPGLDALALDDGGCGGGGGGERLLGESGRSRAGTEVARAEGGTGGDRGGGGGAGGAGVRPQVVVKEELAPYTLEDLNEIIWRDMYDLPSGTGTSASAVP